MAAHGLLWLLRPSGCPVPTEVHQRRSGPAYRPRSAWSRSQVPQPPVRRCARCRHRPRVPPGASQQPNRARLPRRGTIGRSPRCHVEPRHGPPGPEPCTPARAPDVINLEMRRVHENAPTTSVEDPYEISDLAH